MCDHTESVYKNNCIKIVKNNIPENVQCLTKEMQKLRLSNTETTSKEKQNIKSFHEFYDSIPEYDDVNHLSNKEFYKKLDYLRQKQRSFYETMIKNEKYGDNEHNSWYDNYKSLNNHKNSIIKAKTDDTVTQKPPSRRSVRIESPEVVGHNKFKDEKVVKNARVGLVSSADSTFRYKNNRKATKSPFCDSTFDELSDCCTLTTRSVPCSPRKQSVAWKDNNTTQSNTPDTFKMTVRNEDDKIIDEMVINSKKFTKSNDNANGMFKANPVPIESRIPLFDKIMYEQELRSKQVKQQSKAALKAQMNLFSFTKREEEISDITRRLTKSSPDLFLCFNKQKKPKYFKAKPVPRNLFSNYAYQKMHEDEYYRSLQKKIRAEEMLKAASLPPSMAKREKSKPSFAQICPKSFREMYESQMRKIPHSRRKDLEKELAELELDFVLATPSPVNKPKSKTKKKQSRKVSSSNSGKSSRSPSTLESVNRSNLAAVLRIQTSRKRMEEEICRRLEAAHIKEEARWREKVLRKRPVWETLAYSHEEDLNMRLQMRRDEERMRNEEHRLHMESMFGRVNQQPTLFERQSNVKFPKTREELISQLYGTSPPSSDKFLKADENIECSRSTSNDSFRKCVEMKDESIQAKFEELFQDNDNDIQSCDTKEIENSVATGDN